MSSLARPPVLLLHQAHEAIPRSQEAHSASSGRHKSTRFKFRCLLQNERYRQTLGLPKDIAWASIRAGKPLMYHSSDHQSQGQMLGQPANWAPGVVLCHAPLIPSRRDHIPRLQVEDCTGSKALASGWPRAEPLRSYAWKRQKEFRRIEAPPSS